MTDLSRTLRRLGVVVLAAVTVGTSMASSPALGASMPAGGASRRLDSQAAGFNFGIEPYNEPGTAKRSAFDLDGPLSATINDHVEIVNDGPTPQQFAIYPADAYTIEDGGGFAVNLRTDPRTDIATWITLPVQMYTVPGHTATVIPVRLSIPSGATPGDHTAAIVAEQIIAPGQVKTGEGVTVVHRAGARVYLRVDGPVHLGLHIESVKLTHKLPLNPFAAAHTQTLVDLVLKNTGNARVALSSITITMKGFFGRTIHKITLTGQKAGATNAPTEILPAQILPGGRIRLLAPFHGLPPLDHLTVAIGVKGADAVAGTPVGTTASTSFWIIPWLALLILALLVAGYFWFRRWYLRRPRRRNPEVPNEPAPPSQASATQEPARV